MLHESVEFRYRCKSINVSAPCILILFPMSRHSVIKWNETFSNSIFSKMKLPRASYYPYFEPDHSSSVDSRFYLQTMTHDSFKNHKRIFILQSFSVHVRPILLHDEIFYNVMIDTYPVSIYTIRRIEKLSDLASTS